MCVRTHACPHTRTCPRACLIYSHAIKFQATSTSAMRLAEGAAHGQENQGSHQSEGFYPEEKNVSPQVPGSSHTCLPMFGRRRGLSKLTLGYLYYRYSPCLPVDVRSLEVNRVAAPCIWGRSDGKRKKTISGVDAISPQVCTLESLILNNKDVCGDLCGCL